MTRTMMLQSGYGQAGSAAKNSHTNAIGYSVATRPYTNRENLQNKQPANRHQHAYMKYTKEIASHK